MAAGITSIIPRTRKPAFVDPVITITGNRSLKQSENGATVVFNSTTSLIATLPAPFKGARFKFYTKTLAGSGVGHLIKVKGSAEKVYSKVSASGATITESAGKGVVGTQATAVKGDAFLVESDGVDWFGTPFGIYAREA